MKVIHLLRKPCSEPTVAANVLRWGTGGINIDATRISTTPSERLEMLKMSQGFAGRKWGRPEVTNYGYESSMPVKTVSTPSVEGRWPANLVLQHLDGCVQDGVKDGTETVTAWTCEPGCPVAGLDGQSGNTKAVMRKPTGKPIYSTEGTAMVWNSNSVTDTTERGFTDEGGASRFFKQVKA